MTLPHAAFAVSACLAALLGPIDGASASVVEDLRRGLERGLLGRCVTPAVNGVFQQLVDDGSLKTAVGPMFTLTGGSARDDRIELRIEDGEHRAHTVTMALQAIGGHLPDGEAGAFLFYVDQSHGSPSAEASASLLGVATVLARAIPDETLAPCAGRTQGTGTRAAALASAGAQVLVISAALVFGLRALHAVRADRSS